LCRRDEGEPKRCEDALFNIAEINYQYDQRNDISTRERYEAALAVWKENDKRGVEPKPVVVSYAKGMAAHQRYLKALPDGTRRDVVLYRTAFIYGLMGKAEEGLPLLKEIVTRFPSSRQIVPTLGRIGEFYFAQRGDDSAIAYYGKIDPNIRWNEEHLGMFLQHKAEALHRTGKFRPAVDAYFDLVDRCDRGQIACENRQKAILSMGSCFAELSGSYQGARIFFENVGGRRYDDTVILEIADKLRSQGRMHETREAIEDLLHRFPGSPWADSARRSWTF